MAYDEPEDWKLYDLCYKATKEQANTIWMELVATKEWQEFETTDNELRYGHWPDCDRFQHLCRMRMLQVLAVYRTVHALIARHT